MWWLVTYDEETETSSRAIAVVGADRDERVLAWIGGPSAAAILDGLTVEEATPAAVAPVAVMRPHGGVVLALIEVGRCLPGGLQEAVDGLAAAATEVAGHRRSSS